MDYLVDIDTAPDFGLDQDGEFSVDQVQLGDGYIQRRPAGLNSYRRSWSLTWSLISKQQKDDLCNFLNSRLGVAAFLWQDPDGEEVFKVVCPKPAKHVYVAYNLYNVSATFTEDFNP